jgi:hypothetical protein
MSGSVKSLGASTERAMLDGFRDVGPANWQWQPHRIPVWVMEVNSMHDDDHHEVKEVIERAGFFTTINRRDQTIASLQQSPNHRDWDSKPDFELPSIVGAL